MRVLPLLTRLVAALLGLLPGGVAQSPPPSCPSEIFCHGPLLDAVQTQHLFQDSKTFVDMKLKKNPQLTLDLYKNLTSERNLTKDELMQFVESNFDPPGSEFELWSPSDWKENPDFLMKIADARYRSWAYNLNAVWKKLGRKIKNDVKINSDLYSIIYVPHPAIVPGGRFREFYYWDSYWVFKGLLLSEMFDTVKGMLDNFNSIVKRFGKIPNGGRTYYLMRSQPPLYIPMFDLYMEATQDLVFLEKSISFLEEEFQYWMTNHTTTVQLAHGGSYRVALYTQESSGPRPESYREDKRAAKWLNETDAELLYSQLKSAAESGWDFSTRWFIDSNGTNTGNLTNVRTKFIAPVDLNSILCWNANLLAKFYWKLGKYDKAQEYRKIADDWTLTVEKVFWRNNSWFDYDRMNNKSRKYFFPSNLTPLWSGCYNNALKEHYVKSVIGYLNELNTESHLCGVPTSLDQSGEQWDFPNAWPPSQEMIIMGLEKSGVPAARQLAYRLAAKWVACNYEGFRTSGSMYEKYDATLFGRRGGGGEYEVQLGFGWSNGVILELLDHWGYRLDSEPTAGTDASESSRSISTSLRALPGLVLFTGLLLLLSM